MQPHFVTDTTAADDTQEVGTCFECDAPARTEWRDHAFTYGVGGSAAELSVKIPVRVCGACGAEFCDHEAETLEHEAVCAHLGVLPPRDVRRIRDLHGLTRAAFARVTGLGEATLSRWENGILIQNRANDRYLRLLAYPGNLPLLESLDADA